MKKMMAGVVVAMMAMVGSVLAQGPGGPGSFPPDRGGRGPGGREHGSGNRGGMLERVLDNPKMVAKIGLSEEQVQTLRAALFDLKKEHVKHRAALEMASLEQAELLAGDSASEKAIMAAVEKTGRIRTEGAKLRMKRLLVVRNTLTEEQRDKMKALVHRQKRHHSREEARRSGKDKVRPQRGQRRKMPPPPHDDDDDDKDDDDDDDAKDEDD